MIYAETTRLTLRALNRDDLPRIVELIGEWDVARWLVSVPYPYALNDAEAFYARMQAAAESGKPEYFLLETKDGQEQIGAIGLHKSREGTPRPDELEIGYWLGKKFWGQGYMSEAIGSVIDHAFRRQDIALVTSTTDPVNNASQNVLRKAGLHYLGVSPCRDKKALRESAEVTRWQLTRGDYERKNVA